MNVAGFSTHTARNAGANGLVALVNGLIGILTIAYLARAFGPEKYGVWVLIGLVTTYLAVLDIGLISATGRRLAARYAVGDDGSANQIGSTHAAASIGLAVAICALAGVVALLFGHIFAVPESLRRDAVHGVLLTGASVSLYFVFSVFTCQLWALERFDVIAAIEIPVQVAKMLAIIFLIDGDSQLAQLASITLPAHLAAGLAAMAACRRLSPRFELRPSQASMAELRRTLHLGVQLFAHQFTRTMSLLTGTAVVGNRLGPGDVTSYSLARVLTNYAGAFVDTIAQAVAARAVKLHSGGADAKQRELFLIGGRYAAGCALLFLGGFLVLGEPFVRLWQGGTHPEVVLLLSMLAIGEAVAISQSVTTTVLLGMNRQTALIKLYMVEIAVAATLGVLFATQWGVLGVCVAVALSSCLIRGIGQMLIGCRALGVRPLRFIAHAVLPGVTPLALAALATTVVLHRASITDFPGFVAIGCFYAATYVALLCLFWLWPNPLSEGRER